MPRPVIERASANDMMQLASGVGPVPMQVGAVLLLDAGPGFDPGAARGVLGERITGVPRLRQRLMRTPFGCGRPLWVDDTGFELDRHVTVASCPAPGDDAALLAFATELLGTPLDRARPLWRATFVTGLASEAVALVLVFDHVLADGIGGLAVLASLVDGMPAAPEQPFPRPAPSTAWLFWDAATARLHAARRWRHGVVAVRDALTELRLGDRPAAPRTSLNRPTGTRRATRTVRAELDAVRSAAHAHGGTVNDVVLSVVLGALGDLLRLRGEEADHLVVSIPISSRRGATADRLGNEVGVLPVDLPTGGDPSRRLVEIAEITRARKQASATRGSSAVVVGAMIRVLAWLRLLRWFLDHQHMINTLVTNLRGPEDRMALAGATIDRVIPLSAVTGNVPVDFAVLSYAGELTITVNADPDECPDLDELARALQRSLDRLPQLVPS